jgi:hypothetical protein
MKNMTIGDVKPKDEDDDENCHLPLIQAIKIKLVMWKEMKNQFINRLMILHPPLLKMQFLNSRFIMSLQKIIPSIKLLVP